MPQDPCPAAVCRLLGTFVLLCRFFAPIEQSVATSSGPLYREFAMHRAKRLVHLAILISSIGLAAAVGVGPQSSAARPYSGVSQATPVVLRGSDPEATQSSSTNDSVPTVLRGSPPPAPQPSTRDVCASDYNYDPNHGCVTSGYANNPYDSGYWPYYGFGGFLSGGRRHGFRHGFAHGVGRGFTPFSVATSPMGSARFARHLSRGFAHPGGFGRR